ncbi:MAG: SH3 domain-containing protein [Clostridiales bacterium]|nr:SH3 domain-containing protein [Clostridiales bacterium]
MKKILRRFTLFTLCLMALAASPLSAPAEPAAAQAWRHPHQALPMYASADDDKKPLRVLGAGEAFLLLGQKDGWAEIQAFNEAGEPVKGYVRAKGLQPLPPEEGMGRGMLVSEDGSARVPLRRSAGPRGTVLGKYSPGVWVQVLSPAEKGWVRVRVAGQSGYVREEHLRLEAGLPQPVALPEVTVQNTQATGLNLREAPSFKSATLAIVRNGKPVRVLAVLEEFVHVLTEDGRTGFMMAWGVAPQPLYADSVPSPDIPRPDGQVLTIQNQGGQGAHLRARASTGSDSLGLYPNGTQVVLVNWGEYWLKVWVEGREGYMMKRFFDVAQTPFATEEPGYQWTPEDFNAPLPTFGPPADTPGGEAGLPEGA